MFRRPRATPAAVAGEARGDAAGNGVQQDDRIVGAVSAQAATRRPVGDVRGVPEHGSAHACVCRLGTVATTKQSLLQVLVYCNPVQTPNLALHAHAVIANNSWK